MSPTDRTIGIRTEKIPILSITRYRMCQSPETVLSNAFIVVEVNEMSEAISPMRCKFSMIISPYF